ncbi:alpha/beta hydrolase [Streptomyces sp. NPDC051098]|uniref:alpha/beta hydrolase n=1 Tax=Streptomyces sp. NPDC051098 TaxID=3155411 RepID=UPI003414C8FE
MRAKLLVTSTVLAGVALSGCSSPQGPKAREGAPLESDALSAFYEQKIAWKPCPAQDVPDGTPQGVRFECATVRVPLDYGHPERRTLTLALNRLPAASKTTRAGSLMTNPGGPGGSGLQYVYDFASDYSPAVRARYDIVGMDPRGVGASSPVHCLSDQEQARLAAMDGDASAGALDYAKACGKRSGDLLPFLGTDNVARDLDIIRAALGDEKLTYHGVSYGTLLGQFHAHQFPHRAGRMVLDSIVDPTVWPADTTSEAAAFDTALGVFVQTCLDSPKCPMGTSRSAVTREIDDLLTRSNDEPLKAADGTITGLELSFALNQALFDEGTWQPLQQALGAAFRGDTAALTRLLHPEESSTSGKSSTNDGLAENAAVRCLHLRPEQRTAHAVDEITAEVNKAAPLFGPQFLFARSLCTDWPAPPIPNAGRALTAKGAPEILLVQNSFDAATPVQGARSVEGQLDNARLITNISGGHGFYDKGPCTRKVVDDYLTAGALPARGTVCHDRAEGLPNAAPSRH